MASNHAALTSKQKSLGLDNFSKIPVGTNGVQERMVVVWDKCVKSVAEMTPERFVAVTSTNAAKVYGLYPDKGRIDVGSQADIVIWDPQGCTNVDVDQQVSKSDLNIFEGMEFQGKVETVILQGRVVLFEGDLKAVQGFGKFLPLSPYSAHVYEPIKSRIMYNFHPVERQEEDIITNGDIPPPAKPISIQPEKAASLHISNFDLKSHPNDEDEPFQKSPSPPTDITRNKHRSSIRIRNPPGGRTSGSFW